MIFSKFKKGEIVWVKSEGKIGRIHDIYKGKYYLFMEDSKFGKLNVFYKENLEKWKPKKEKDEIIITFGTLIKERKILIFNDFSENYYQIEADKESKNPPFSTFTIKKSEFKNILELIEKEEVNIYDG